MILKRVLAYLVDYLIIVLYAGLLFMVSYAIHGLTDISLTQADPITGNLISFFALTVPVFLYFYFFESGKMMGSLGKQLLRIVIENNTRKNILIRTGFKILPWEMAHIGIHWSYYYSSENITIPWWNWVLNILPQVIVLFYFITVVISRGHSSIYDKVANTKLKILKTL